jgi:predicted Holliday junction resolvase-like endonuclease
VTGSGSASLALGFAIGAALAGVIAFLYFQIWKLRNSRALRLDAVQRSQAVTVGKVTEQIVPFFPEFAWNPKDARFLGTPVDFVVFDGLAEGDVRRVVFVEVKTAGAGLSSRERQVREAVQDRRVAWVELRVDRRNLEQGETGAGR